MTDSRNAELSIRVSCPGFESDDHWDITGQLYEQCWLEISDVLSKHEVKVGNAAYTLTADWYPVPRLIRRMHNAHRQLFSNKRRTGEDGSRAAKFPRRPARVTIKSSAVGKVEHHWRHTSVVESWLYDVFLIANLSTPGAGDFYRVTVLNPASPFNRFSSALSLSGLYFSLAFVDTHDGKWPFVKNIAVSRVNRWFRAIRPWCSQVPSSDAEKVLFSLFHIATTEMSPVTVIWIFYALETLYATRVGENQRVLLDRISLLLNPDAAQKANLKKQLKKLYDIRSSLVHGGFELAHPEMNESIDKRVDQVHDKWIRLSEYGVRVLLVSIQTLIERDMQWPRFVEVLQGSDEAGSS